MMSLQSGTKSVSMMAMEVIKMNENFKEKVREYNLVYSQKFRHLAHAKEGRKTLGGMLYMAHSRSEEALKADLKAIIFGGVIWK